MEERVGVVFGREAIGQYEEWLDNPTNELLWEFEDNVRLTTFANEAEAKAYRLGIEDAIGWTAEPRFLDLAEMAALGLNDSCQTLLDLCTPSPHEAMVEETTT
jgi:hypothetical protein